MVAARQVRAPDAARKEDIPSEEELRLPVEKAQAAGAMAGDFEHLHFQAEEISRGRFFDQKVRVHRLEFELKSEAAKKVRVGNHRRRLGVARNRAVEPVFDLRDVWDVIEVSMREEEKF